MGTEHNYEELLASRKSIYETVDKAGLDAIFAYAEEYKKFLDAAKTEREATVFAVSMAEKAGYTPYTFGDALKPGDRRYFVNKGKGIYLFRIGTAPLSEVGFRILAAHIDSPRIDLKQNPLYEDSGMSFFKTHYYGGIKKYQWTALPLALHGVIVRADGETVTVSIGEEPGDPVFYINDLLPHLGQDQAQQPLGKAISGESLNLLVGGIPVADGKEGEAIKLNVLRLLNEKYGIEEADFLSAELSAVPAERARDVGFDRAFISAYGHDDRCCAYPALTALFDTENNDKTVFVILADKEEIGSNGNTGMRCRLFPDLLDSISLALGENPAAVRHVSHCLSADVNAAFDPNFPEVYEKRNSALISCGPAMSKFTGSRGKSGSNDASAEYVGFVRRLFTEAGVAWQAAELGKVDIGGGGTVAMFIAEQNIDTVDLGVPVISMHAPYEVISKADLYALHQAFSAFCR